MEPTRFNIRLAKVFESRYGLIVGIALRYVPIPDLARDVAQEVFIRLVQLSERRELDWETEINPLLHEITKNVAANVWKRERKHLPAAMRTVAERLLRQRPEKREDRFLDERLDQLNECLDRLTPRGRDLIVAHYIDGIPMGAIARQNKMKPDAIRQAFSRLRNALRHCMERLKTKQPD